LIIPGIDETAAGFSQALLLFIASHGTPEDCHELVQQLPSPRKPRNIPVQAFYYCLRELNDYINWLPENETPLIEEQIKQAFYDAMPSTWHEGYIQAGHLSVLMTIAQLLRYFCQQEHLAIQKKLENQSSQRSQHKTSTPKHRFTPRGSVKESTTE
jgi:hypothetical protein